MGKYFPKTMGILLFMSSVQMQQLEDVFDSVFRERERRAARVKLKHLSIFVKFENLWGSVKKRLHPLSSTPPQSSSQILIKTFGVMFYSKFNQQLSLLPS